MAETARRPDLNLLKGVMTKWISALNERHLRIVTISLEQTRVVDGSLLPTASYSPSEEGRCSAIVLFNSKTKFFTQLCSRLGRCTIAAPSSCSFFQLYST